MRARDLYKASSLLNWWPKVKDLGIPVPRTRIVVYRRRTLQAFLEPSDPREYDRIHRAVLRFLLPAQDIGYPLFLRTDQASGKHDYRSACYVPAPNVMVDHIARVIEFNETADPLGLPYKALVFREYIPLAVRFTAFRGHLPIAPERRYFVRDGALVCHHPYWPHDALRDDAIIESCVGAWQTHLAEMNAEDPDEVELLTDYALRVSRAVPGYWSVDFALAADHRWILIDMARGEVSYHWPGCPKAESAKEEVG